MLLRAVLVLIALLVPSSAFAAACVTTAFANGTTGGSPWAWGGATTWCTISTTKGNCAGGGGATCTLTAGNAVVFDANTTGGSYTVSTISIASLASAGATGVTNTGAGTITISGNNFDISALTWSATAAITFTATSGTNNIKSGGNSIGALTLNGSGGTFEVLDALATTGSVTLTAGTLDLTTNNPNFTLAGNLSGTGTLNCGSGTWTLTGATGNIWTPTGTITCGSAAFNITNASPSGLRLFTGGAGNSYGAVAVTGLAAPSEWAVDFTISTSTFASLTLGCGTVLLSNNQTLTLTNLTITGTSAACPVFIESLGVNSATPLITFAVTNAPTINWAIMANVAYNGTPNFTATNSISAGFTTSTGAGTMTIAGPSTGHVIGGE